MEREASGQGGCGGLILPLFVLDVRRRTGTGVGLWSPTFLARRLGQRRPLTSVPLAWTASPARI